MEHTSLTLPPLSTSGEVITFYSYKGGTGRTMALSNIAVLLARQQNATTPVLMIDWDLEAPGLHHYFGAQLEQRPGLLEFFEACREQLPRLRHDGQDAEALAQAVLAEVDWQRYVSRVDQGSQLYLMRAGRFDASYADRLAAMRWDELFHDCPPLYRCFGQRLSRHFRHVLVDSRSGRGDSAGICTTLLPRKLVLVFTPSHHSLEGVQEMVTRATTYRRSHEEEQRPLLIYPLPSRIEVDDARQRAQWRRGDSSQQIPGYQPSFEDLIRDCYGMQQVSLESYFDEVQLQLTRDAAGGEPVAVRQDEGGDRFSLTRTFDAFLAWLAPGYLPWQSSAEITLSGAIDAARQLLDQGGAAARAAWQPLARDLNQLGELYRREGKLRAALAGFEESLALRQRGLGEDHPETLATKLNLAQALRQLARLDEAQFLEECVAEARERTLGAEHVDTLAARGSLAHTLGLQGRLAEALALQDGVLESWSRLLGPEHPQTLTSLAARADLLLRRGELEAARVVQERVLVSRQRVLGTQHADTLRGKTALARTLLQMQDLDGARRLLDEVLQAQLGRLGADHAETRNTRELLIDVQLHMGMPADEAPMVPELHQDASMDDYAEALERPLAQRNQSGLGKSRLRSPDELLALDIQLSGLRGTPR